tara:strand:+ start:9031 stop:10161 length:1131 start_codon:yes stop_codon:yes gene_type:complete
MIILESELKQLVREETLNFILENRKEDIEALREGLLTEAEFWKRAKDWAKRKGIPWATAAAILAGSLGGSKSAIADPPDVPAQTQVAQAEKDSFLSAFYNTYPEAQDESVNSDIKRQIAEKEKEIKGKIALNYLSEQRKEAFVKFIQNMDRFKEQSREQILQKFDVLKPEILKIIENLPVELVHEGVQTDRMYRSFRPGFSQSGGQVAAAYDEESNKVVVNPYEYMANGQLNMTEFENSLREEIYHAIDHTLSATMIPMSRLQTQAAKAMDIFLSQEETGLSQERYDYLTSDHEFYAKMLRLKDIVAEKFPDQIINGQLDQKFLETIIQAKDPNILGDPAVLEILQVLDPAKIDNISKFFDQLAKVEKTAATSQIA